MTVRKRERERMRQERQQEKAAKRKAKKDERARPGDPSAAEEDPDIAGIVPGPQPREDA
jgi:hypothetical protein